MNCKTSSKALPKIMAQKITVEEYRDQLLEEQALLEKVGNSLRLALEKTPASEKVKDQLEKFSKVIDDKKWETEWMHGKSPNQWGRHLTELLEELEETPSEEIKSKIHIVKNLIFMHAEGEFLNMDLTRREAIMRGLLKYLQKVESDEN